MININCQIYKDLAQLLLEKIEDKPFFNGTIEYDTTEFYSVLKCTLIVCRQKDDHPTRISNSKQTEKIISVLPVWWEYKIFMEDGEHLNDFCWNEFNQYFDI